MGNHPRPPGQKSFHKSYHNSECLEWRRLVRFETFLTTGAPSSPPSCALSKTPRSHDTHGFGGGRSNLAKLPRSEQDCLLGWAPDDVEQEGPGASADLLFLTHDRATHRLYHLIRQERPHFMESIEPRDYYQVFVVEPARSFERIRAQSGAFLISAFHERFEREKVLKWNAGIPVYDHFVMDVPNKHKDSIIRELSLLRCRAREAPSWPRRGSAVDHPAVL